MFVFLGVLPTNRRTILIRDDAGDAQARRLQDAYARKGEDFNSGRPLLLSHNVSPRFGGGLESELGSNLSSSLVAFGALHPGAHACRPWCDFAHSFWTHFSLTFHAGPVPCPSRAQPCIAFSCFSDSFSCFSSPPLQCDPAFAHFGLDLCPPTVCPLSAHCLLTVSLIAQALTISLGSCLARRPTIATTAGGDTRTWHHSNLSQAPDPFIRRRDLASNERERER